MIKPTNRELEALATLEHNADFKVLMGWFNKSLDDVNIDMRIAIKSTAMRRCQGRALEISELIEHASNARNIIAARSR